jgi:hypothetical protein
MMMSDMSVCSCKKALYLKSVLDVKFMLLNAVNVQRSLIVANKQ